MRLVEFQRGNPFFEDHYIQNHQDQHIIELSQQGSTYESLRLGSIPAINTYWPRLDRWPIAHFPKHLQVHQLLLHPAEQADLIMKKVFASLGGSVRPRTQCTKACASTEALERDPKMRIINVVFLRTLSEIKLKRTDTTLDLSQKAKRAEERKEEKKMEKEEGERRFI
jgi:hypothetical protein